MVGALGELYTYHVYTWPARLSSGPGNFIFANSLGGGHWRPVSIGESSDLATLADHERLRNSNSWQPPSHVHVRLNFNPTPVLTAGGQRPHRALDVRRGVCLRSECDLRARAR